MRLRQYSTSERINIAGLITSVLFLSLLLLPSEIPAQGYGLIVAFYVFKFYNANLAYKQHFETVRKWKR